MRVFHKEIAAALVFYSHFSSNTAIADCVARAASPWVWRALVCASQNHGLAARATTKPIAVFGFSPTPQSLPRLCRRDGLRVVRFGKLETECRLARLGMPGTDDPARRGRNRKEEGSYTEDTENRRDRGGNQDATHPRASEPSFQDNRFFRAKPIKQPDGPPQTL